MQELKDEYQSLKRTLDGMDEALRRSCTALRLKKREELMAQDAPVDSVYLVCSGKLEVEYLGANGRIYDFAELQPDDFVGDMEVILGETRSRYTVKAATGCEVLRIPRDGFVNWLNSDEKLARHLLKSVTAMWSVTSHSLTEYTTYDAVYKLAVHLQNLAPEDAAQNGFVVKSRRQGMADQLGVNVRTVNRSVRALKEQGCLTVIHAKIFISAECYDRLRKYIQEHKAEDRASRLRTPKGR